MIGIFVAMDAEKKELLQIMQDYQTEEYIGSLFHIGVLSGKEVCVVAGGVGKVASAITCSALLEHFHCDMIINIGTAGGIKDYENILDVVVVDKALYHDWDSVTVNDCSPSFANFEELGKVYHCDEHLVELAKQTMEQFSEHQTFVGPIATGDCFMTTAKSGFIEECFPEALACDMESAAIGNVCTTYGVPFLVIRSLSDIVTKEGNTMDFLTYVEQASARAAHFTERFIAQI